MDKHDNCRQKIQQHRSIARFFCFSIILLFAGCGNEGIRNTTNLGGRLSNIDCIKMTMRSSSGEIIGLNIHDPEIISVILDRLLKAATMEESSVVVIKSHKYVIACFQKNKLIDRFEVIENYYFTDDLVKGQKYSISGIQADLANLFSQFEAHAKLSEQEAQVIHNTPMW